MSLPRRTATRIYWPNCQVCQYMKKNKQFRYDVMQSTYFNPHGQESLMEVNRRYGGLFTSSTLYAHMKRHQHKDILAAEKRADEMEKAAKGIKPILPAVVQAVEGQVVSTQDHERGLDKFIREGEEMLDRREMKLSATTYLQAIKIKADIEKSTKDRRLDAVKSMFKGISGNEKPGLTEGQE